MASEAEPSGGGGSPSSLIAFLLPSPSPGVIEESDLSDDGGADDAHSLPFARMDAVPYRTASGEKAVRFTPSDPGTANMTVCNLSIVAK